MHASEGTFPCGFCPAVIRPQRKKLFPRIPVMLALTEGRVLVGQWVCKCPFTQSRTQCHYHCPSLSQSGQICSGSAGLEWLPGYWLVTMDSVPVDVAACNLFARKLHFFARADFLLLARYVPNYGGPEGPYVIFILSRSLELVSRSHDLVTRGNEILIRGNDITNSSIGSGKCTSRRYRTSLDHGDWWIV